MQQAQKAAAVAEAKRRGGFSLIMEARIVQSQLAQRVAQLLKIASLAHLPHGAEAAAIRAQEKRSDMLALALKIWIGADFDLLEFSRANIPKRERRGGFEVTALDAEKPTSLRREFAGDEVPAGLCGKLDGQLLVHRL